MFRFYVLHRSEPRQITTRTGTAPSAWKVWQFGRMCFQIGGSR